MSITIVVTSGAENANSYATSLEVDDYAQAAFAGASWTALATQPLKDALLVRSTRLLDMLNNFSGRRVTSTQRLAWPRAYVERPSLCGYYNIDEIPQAVKDAQCELAIWLASQTAGSSDPFAGDDLANFDSMTIGPISLDFVNGATASPGTIFFTSVVVPILRAGACIGRGGRLIR